MMQSISSRFILNKETKISWLLHITAYYHVREFVVALLVSLSRVAVVGFDSFIGSLEIGLGMGFFGNRVELQSMFFLYRIR